MAQQQFQASLDRLDTLFTVATLTLESDYEPGRRELQFFIDSGVQILDDIRQAIAGETIANS